MRKKLVNRNGISLIELLIYVAIAAVVLAGLLVALQVGFRIWASQSEIVALQQDERMVLDHIARELRMAKRSTVKILENPYGSGQVMLQFLLAENNENVMVAYFTKYNNKSNVTDLMCSRDRGYGPGVDPVLTGIKEQTGFTFCFYDTNSYRKHQTVGWVLQEYEVVEMVICSERQGKCYEMRTLVAPRTE